MDEAERCHEIAYIAYGELLAHGTVDEVIKGSNLMTYTAMATIFPNWTIALTGAPGVEIVSRSAPACMCPAATTPRYKRRSMKIPGRYCA